MKKQAFGDCTGYIPALQGCSSPFSLSFIINHTFGLPISFPKAFKSASKLPSDPSLCLSNQGASGRERNYSLLI